MTTQYHRERIEHKNNLDVGKDGALREIQSGEELFLNYGAELA